MNLAGLIGLADVANTLRAAVKSQPVAAPAPSPASRVSAPESNINNDIAQRVAATQARLAGKMATGRARGAVTFGTLPQEPQRDKAATSPHLRAPQVPKAEALAGQKATGVAI